MATTIDKLAHISVKDPQFGAKGDGSTDDTAAIDAAYNYNYTQGLFKLASEVNMPSLFNMTGPSLYFPTGDYIYNGNGLLQPVGSRKVCHLFGDGILCTRIRNNNPNTYFMDFERPSSVQVHDLWIHGGKGAVRFGNTSNPNRVMYWFERLIVSGFSECGIGTNAVDMPKIKIRDCHFWVGSSTLGQNAIGIAVSGFTDHVQIVGNMFQQDMRGFIKIGRGGNSIKIWDNYMPGSTHSNGFDIWFVPEAAGGPNYGAGGVIWANKMTNEGISASQDVPRILIADEDSESGTDFLSRRPSTAVSTGTVGGIQFVGNVLNWPSPWGEAVIVSYTPLLRHWLWRSNVFAGTRPPWLLRWADGVSPSSLSEDSVFDLSHGIRKPHGSNYLVTNVNGSVRIIDPWGATTQNSAPGQ